MPAEVAEPVPHPAPFFGAKSAPNGQVRRVRFSCRTATGMPSLQMQVFGGKRAPDDHLLFGPEKRRTPARRACHHLSPLRHRSLSGRKVRKSAPVFKRTRFLASLSQSWNRVSRSTGSQLAELLLSRHLKGLPHSSDQRHLVHRPRVYQDRLQSQKHGRHNPLAPATPNPACFIQGIQVFANGQRCDNINYYGCMTC